MDATITGATGADLMTAVGANTALLLVASPTRSSDLVDALLVTAPLSAVSLFVPGALEALLALTTGCLAETAGAEAASTGVDVAVLVVDPPEGATTPFPPDSGDTFVLAEPDGLRADDFAVPAPLAAFPAIPGVDFVVLADVFSAADEFSAAGACRTVAEKLEESAAAVPQQLPITVPIPRVTAKVPTLPIIFIEFIFVPHVEAFLLVERHRR